MAFPQVASTSTSIDTTTGTTHLILLPSGIVVGDLLLLALYGSCLDATPNTAIIDWMRMVDLVVTNSTGHMAVFYKVANGSEGSSVNATVDSPEDCAAAVYRITDWHGTTLPAWSTGVTLASTAPNPDSLSPPWGAEDTKYISIGSTDGATAITGYPANYTGNQIVATTSTAAGGSVAMATRNLNAASDDPGAFTASASARSAALTVAIRPAAASGNRRRRIICGGGD